MKMICEVPDEVIKCIKDGMWCGSHVLEKMIENGIPLSSSENPNKSEIMTGWIPVSERLPEKDDLYLVNFDDGAYHLAYFSNGACDYSDVIAWMPLPAPFDPQESEG